MRGPDGTNMKTLREIDCLPATTYDVLGGNKVRCRKTQLILNAKSAKSHRHSLGCKEAPRKKVAIDPVIPSQPVPKYRTATIGADGSVNCPYCEVLHFGIQPGLRVCRYFGCAQSFIAELPKQPQREENSDVPVAYIGTDDWVNCPHCGRLAMVYFAGRKICSRCFRAFEALYSSKFQSGLKQAYINEDDEVRCPHCSKLQRCRDLRVVTCIECDKEFQALFA